MVGAVKDQVLSVVTLFCSFFLLNFEWPTIKWLRVLCCDSCPKPSRGRFSKLFCIRGTVQRPLPGPKPSRKRSQDICLITTSSGSRTHILPSTVIRLVVEGTLTRSTISCKGKPLLALSWHFCFFDLSQFFRCIRKSIAGATS